MNIVKLILGVKFLFLTIVFLSESIKGVEKSDYIQVFIGLVLSCIFGFLSYLLLKKLEKITNEKKNKKKKL